MASGGKHMGRVLLAAFLLGSLLFFGGERAARGYTRGQGLLSVEQAEQQAQGVRSVLQGYMDRTGTCVSVEDKVGYGGLVNLKDEEGTLHMNPPRSGFEVALFLKMKDYLAKNPGSKMSLEDLFRMGIESCASPGGNVNLGDVFLSLHNVVRILARPENWTESDAEKPGWRKIRDMNDPAWPIIQDVCGIQSAGGGKTLAELLGMKRLEDLASLSPEKAEKIRKLQEKRRGDLEAALARHATVEARLDALRRSIPYTPYATVLPESSKVIIQEIEALSKERVALDYQIENLRSNPTNNLVDRQIGFTLFDPTQGIFKPLPGAEEWVGNGGNYYYFWLGSIIQFVGGGKSVLGAAGYERLQKYLGSEEEYARGLVQLSHFVAGSKLGSGAYGAARRCELHQLVARTVSKKGMRLIPGVQGGPGGDNPDDNENIGAALLPLTPLPRKFLALCAEKNPALLPLFQDRESAEELAQALNPEVLGFWAEEGELSGDRAGVESTSGLGLSLAQLPSVAVLNEGYAGGAVALLARRGEPSVLLSPRVAPEVLARYAVLVIPSGALAEWSTSAALREKLETYAAGGGRILALAQQLGRHYGVLPGAPSAYGWAEDQSCQFGSVALTAPVGAFASQTREKPDFNVDGYFLDYPPRAEVLLARTKNDQPCLLSYAVGRGRVTAANLYLDWAAANHQGTGDEALLFRDLVDWLASGAGEGASLPSGAPGSPIALEREVRYDAPSSEDATVALLPEVLLLPPGSSDLREQLLDAGRKDVLGVAAEGRLVLLDPDGNLLEGEFFPCDLSPGEARRLRFETPTLPTPGFYRGFLELRDLRGSGVASLSLGWVATVVASPALTGWQRRELTFSAQSDLENYVRGCTGKFSLVGWNRGNALRRLRVEYRLPHNQGYAKDPSLYQGNISFDVPPGGQGRYDFSCPLVNADGIDRLWATFFDGVTGENLGTVSKGFYTKEPSARVEMAPSRKSVAAGESLEVAVRGDNPFGIASSGRMAYAVTDAAGATFSLEERDMTCSSQGFATSADLELPRDLFSGTAVLQATVSIGGGMVGIGEAPFEFVGSPVPLAGRVGDRFSKKGLAGAAVAFHFGGQLFETVTDGEGRFALSLPSAAYKIEARGEGYVRMTREQLVYPGENEPLELLLLPEDAGVGTGSVEGTCRDRITDEPLGGVAVRFEGGGETYDVRTDGRGRFGAALPPGDYGATVWREGAPVSDRFPLRILEGWRQRIDLYGAVGKFALEVRDLSTEVPLEDVRVEIFRPGNEKTRRDVSVQARAGEVRTAGGGRWGLHLEKEGYGTLETEIFVNERPGRYPFFLKKKAFPLEIVVRDLLTGDPVSGAAVRLDRPEGAPGPRGSADVGGRVRLEPEEGRFALTLEREGYRSEKTELFAGPQGGGSGEFWMRPEATPWELEVRDLRNDAPLEGVKVRLARPDGAEPRGGTTDARGRFATVLKDGRWTVRMEREGFALLETETWLSAASPAVRERRGAERYYLAPDLALPQGTLTLVVQDEYAALPLEGVAVTARHVGGVEVSGRTDGAGRVALALPDGRGAFHLEKDGYEVLDTELFFSHRGVSEEPLWLTPSRASRTFLVRDLQTEGVLEGVELWALEGEKVDLLGRSGGGGTLAVTVSGGRRSFRFIREGYETLETEFFWAPGPVGREIPEVVYLAPRTRTFRGVVRDPGGTPIAGASVTAVWGEEHRSATSGSDGSFSVELPGGVGELALAAPGFEGRRLQIFWGLRQEAPCPLVLRPIGEPGEGEGTLTFSVIDAVTGHPLPNFSIHLGNLGRQDVVGSRVTARFVPGDRDFLVQASGYRESGWFRESTVPGAEQGRTIALMPVAGELVLHVRDALTGEMLPRFTAHVVDTGWQDVPGGSVAVRQDGQNRGTLVKADGYVETGWFSPRTFPGRSVERTVALRPVTGELVLHVQDALTGEPLPRFTAHLVDTGWREGEGGLLTARQDGQNRNTLVKADGYFETGWFTPRAFPGRKVERTVPLWPVQGDVEFFVVDALTGEPLPRFTAHLVDTGWREGEGGLLTARQDGQNRNTLVKADGYFETGWFTPRAFPGRKVERTVPLWPVQGDVEFSVVDALTGEPLPRFTAQLVDTGWRDGEGGFLGARQDGQNRNTLVKAEGYFETGWFSPSAVPGKVVRRTVALWPTRGEYGVQVRNALTGEALPAFTAHLVDGGWRDVEGDGLVVSQDRNNRSTLVKAPGYLETGWYLPAAVPGKRVTYPVDLFPGTPAGRVEVRVEDLVTGSPLAGASVATSDGRTLVSDAEGRVFWESSGHFVATSVAASAPGYGEERMPCFFTTGHRDLAVILPLAERLGPGKGGMLVVVRGGRNVPVSGAQVTLGQGELRDSSVADAAGKVLSRDMASGIYTVAVEAPGFLSWSGRAAVRSGAVATLPVTLSPLSAQRRPAPFAPALGALPGEVTLRRGEKTTLAVTLRNEGDITGRASCTLDLPSVYRETRDVVLTPGAFHELRFDVTPAIDAPGATFPYTVSLKPGESFTGMATVEAPVYKISAHTDKAAYREGERLVLSAHIAVTGGLPSSEDHRETCIFRVTFNDEVRRKEVVLEKGEGSVTVEDVPVAFHGNKLLFGLYDVSGTALALDALYVLPEGALNMALDRPQYAAGDEALLTLRGTPGTPIRLESPLWEGLREVPLSPDGAGELRIPLPEGMATGSYLISGEGVSVHLDVRGKEMKILDRTMERRGDEVRLLWSARSRGVPRCAWTVALLESDGTPGGELASGDVALFPDGRPMAIAFSRKSAPLEEARGISTSGDLSVHEVPEDHREETDVSEQEGYLLTLSDPEDGHVLAVVRYWE